MSLTPEEIDCIAENIYAYSGVIGAFCGIPQSKIDSYRKIQPNKERLKQMLTDWNDTDSRGKVLCALRRLDENWAILSYRRKFEPDSVKGNSYSCPDMIKWLMETSVGVPGRYKNLQYWKKCGLSIVDIQRIDIDTNDDTEKFLYGCASMVAHKIYIPGDTALLDFKLSITQ